MVTPGFSRPMAPPLSHISQCDVRFTRSGPNASGSQASMSIRSNGPFSAMIPITVCGSPLIRMMRPTSAGSDPKCDAHAR